MSLLIQLTELPLCANHTMPIFATFLCGHNNINTTLFPPSLSSPLATFPFYWFLSPSLILMPFGTQSYNAAAAAKRRQLSLLLSGVCLALLLFAFSCTYTGYQASWYRTVNRNTASDAPLAAFEVFAEVIDAETDCRVFESTGYDVGGGKKRATEAALAVLKGRLRAAGGDFPPDFAARCESYRAAGGGAGHMGELLAAHMSGVQDASAAVLSLIHDGLTPRPRVALDTALTTAAAAAYASIASRALYLHGSQPLKLAAEQPFVSAGDAARLGVHLTKSEALGRVVRHVGPHCHERRG